MTDLATNRSDRFPKSPLALADFYQAMFAQSEFALYVFGHVQDDRFVFQDANDIVINLAERPLDEIRGKTPVECLPQEIGECLQSNLEQCLKTGEIVNYERTVDTPHGLMTWKSSLTPVFDRQGRITHIVGMTRDISQERNTLQWAQHRAEMLRALGLALPAAIYLFNVRQEAIHFIGGDPNEQRQKWRRGAEENAGRATEMYFHPEDHARARAHLRDLMALEDGVVSVVDFRILTAEGDYRRHLMRETVFNRDSTGQVEYVLGVSEDISEQDRAQQEIRDLSERMLTLQIDERRRIAQELHDSTGQHLTALSLALGRAYASSTTLDTSNGARTLLLEALDDARHSLSEAHHEIRVLSYLLLPPQIRTQGLGEAVAEFARGFGKRAGIDVCVEIAPNLDRIGDDVELHLFRICQEALTNVYRHAHARRALVRLEVEADMVRLTVRDDGIGFDDADADPHQPRGVGLTGMRERMHRLGGNVQISGSPEGTTLVAIVPRPA